MKMPRDKEKRKGTAFSSLKKKRSNAMMLHDPWPVGSLITNTKDFVIKDASIDDWRLKRNWSLWTGVHAYIDHAGLMSSNIMIAGSLNMLYLGLKRVTEIEHYNETEEEIEVTLTMPIFFFNDGLIAVLESCFEQSSDGGLVKGFDEQLWFNERLRGLKCISRGDKLR